MGETWWKVHLATKMVNTTLTLAGWRKISITALAPTKAFNLAGLQTEAVVVLDEVLRHKMWRALNTDEVAEPNAFAVDVAMEIGLCG